MSHLKPTQQANPSCDEPINTGASFLTEWGQQLAAAPQSDEDELKAFGQTATSLINHACQEMRMICEPDHTPEHLAQFDIFCYHYFTHWLLEHAIDDWMTLSQKVRSNKLLCNELLLSDLVAYAAQTVTNHVSNSKQEYPVTSGILALYQIGTPSLECLYKQIKPFTAEIIAMQLDISHIEATS